MLVRVDVGVGEAGAAACCRTGGGDCAPKIAPSKKNTASTPSVINNQRGGRDGTGAAEVMTVL
ncbi:hypothetical protein GCM10017566_54350 [Amycolatopsis bartoniae]|uniref:Uncharacterized protein n=1 Tax=Amycolatopsis bartoniae TaxID=941986 RepID=A0A8H9M7F1_9PSEU|nr:hypothetical protein GCM10017566_54350 [Amycolatopsis bartoniae]